MESNKQNTSCNDAVKADKFKVKIEKRKKLSNVISRIDRVFCSICWSLFIFMLFFLILVSTSSTKSFLLLIINHLPIFLSKFCFLHKDLVISAASFLLILSPILVIITKLIIQQCNHIYQFDDDDLKRYFNETNAKYDVSNVFVKKILHYLGNDTPGRCLIISGAWGSGKSHQITHFFDMYLMFRSIHAYTVSCYGITNHSELTTLLQDEMRKKDGSIANVIISALKNIPMIGDLLYILYDQKNKVSRIKEDDIIIIEDIERTQSPNAVDLIGGWANELAERYHLKVILVCAPDVMPEGSYNMLYSKLACDSIEISPEPFMNALYSMAQEKDLSHGIFKDIEQFLGATSPINGTHMLNMIAIFSFSGITNTRCPQHVLHNFYYLYSIYQKELEKSKSTEIIYSYLYSILFNEIAKEKKYTLEYDFETPPSFGELYFHLADYKSVKNDSWISSLLEYPTNYYWLDVTDLNNVKNQHIAYLGTQQAPIRYKKSIRGYK